MADDKLTDSLNQAGPIDLSAWDSRPFLEKITGLVPSIIYIFNQRNQSNEYSNRSIGESLGYTSEEVADMGESLMPQLIHPEDLGKVGAHFNAILEMQDGEVATLEYRIKHKSGGWVWLLSHDTIFERDQAGAVLRHIGMASDISAQKKAEESALAINEELQSFAYSISHDLKSPTNTLNLLLEELGHSHGNALDEDGKHLLDSSLQTVHRMQRLIDDVLHYTKIVGDTLVPETVSLNQTLKEVVNDLQHEINARQATIVCEDLPSVQGSPTQLRILFQNLISNSIKYCDKDTSPCITISDTSRQHPEHRLSVSVKDNGIGIPAGNQGQVFSLFRRLHLHDEFAGGTGLGLAICKRIAQSHEADILLDSEVGKGSTFTLGFR